MTRNAKKTLFIIVGILVLLFVVALAYAMTPSQTRVMENPAAAGAQGATAAAPDQAALVQQGRYVATTADCIACHQAKGGQPYSGGLAVHSPIGNIYATNITPDKDTGIGNYTLNDFDRAIRHGIRQDGTTLYPAMPYPSYAKMSDQDVRALYAFFMHEVKPVRAQNRDPDIVWPLSMRWPLAIWRKTFAPADMAPLQLAKYQSEQLARGAYLVQGPGHCGTCHTPRATTMQELALDESGKEFLAGGPLIDGWRAVNLRGDPVDGLGSETAQDIVDTLRTARNRKGAVVGGPMMDVVYHSTQNMTDGDVQAIAVYLKSLPAHGGGKATFTPTDATAKALAAGQDTTRGAQLWLDNCNACHRVDGGNSVNKAFPVLPGNPTVLADDPTSLIRLVLAGSRLPTTKQRPSDLAMPGFGWRLSDDETAQLVNFVRNSWGNHAPEASASEVANVRKALKENGGRDMDQANTR